MAQPLLWLAGLLFISLWVMQRRPKLGRRLIATALVGLLGLGWLPVPDFGVRALEQRYEEIAPDADVSEYAGVIVLGGALDSGYVAQAHLQPALNDAAERMTATAALLLRNPQLPVIFTGGEGNLLGSGPTESDRARTFFSSLGIANDRVRYESQSRSTYENAVLSSQLPGVEINQKWLLVTSAWHMPRSVATFQKLGWNVTAYPVDFRTGDSTPWTQYNLQDGAKRWELLLHECIGIVAYRLAGRL